jgi:hypothetical protein
MDPLPQICRPFIGREKELAALLELHRLRRNVLIVGSPGVGKSALLRQVRDRLPLLLIHRAVRLKDLFNSLEEQLELEQIQVSVTEAKNNLLARIQAKGRPVAFDSVADTPKEVAKFIFDLSTVAPVWIVCRSDLPHEIGRVSEGLSDFVRLSLPPLKLTEVRSYIALSVQRGGVRKDVLTHVSTLYSLCRGNPKILVGLMTELSRPEYKDKECFEGCLEGLKLFANQTE